MTRKRFWQMIEQSRRTVSPGACDNLELQRRELADLLSALPVDELLSFSEHFFALQIKAYDHALWGAAYLMGQGCSDDGFHYFRNWLISMGRRVYDRALKNPDSLAEIVHRQDIDAFFFEEFAYVVGAVYEERTGREMPETSKLTYPREPTGTSFDEDDMEYFRRTFPRLWAVYGAELSRPA